MGGLRHPAGQVRTATLKISSRALGMAAAACLLLGGSSRGAEPEIIELKDGHQITGEVVAEKPGALFVDLGFDVVKVPKDQVVSRRKRGEAAPASAPATVVSADSDPKGFYKVNPGKVRPVKELVRDFGEGVIS